jgi:ubiquinone/menaquinone biosynthesis C-methylase UbiE
VNVVHNVLCSSGWWARRVKDKLIPWGLEGVELGDDLLEVGPGFGASTRLLVNMPGHLTVVELEERYCNRLRDELGDAVTVVQGDATGLPFDDARFSAVVCFTMLHHIPVPEERQQALAAVARVLRPGGIFAGTDSVGTSALFKLIHLGDTLLTIDPDELSSRLQAVGLTDAQVKRSNGSFRFRARRPA